LKTGSDRVFENEYIKSVILEKITFDIKQEFPTFNIKLDLARYTEAMSRNLVHHLRYGILGERKKKRIPIPKNWWEKLKLEKFPPWILKYFPVQFKNVDILDYFILYPDLPLPIENHKNFYYFETIQNPYKNEIENGFS